MYNFGKKIVGVFIVFLLFGNIVLGQTDNNPECTTNQDCIDKMGSNGKCTDGICTNIPEVTVVACSVKGAERNTLGICRCPKGTKEIEKKCVPCSDPGVCCGIELNTKVPFIGNCIEFGKGDVSDSENEISATQEEAFPKLMGGLMRILVTIIMLGSFVAILVGGVMISSAGPDEQKATKGKKLIIDVVIALAILGASGVILRLINPNFFQ
ncbi:MAG: hypothetical protein PHR61_01255 [Candidatus Absconditabacteria bacterium]|nr:hypothetical protein [Candidatus Absconditabacteria bacterium]